MAIDWQLARPVPNFIDTAINGMAAGRQMAQQQAQDAAYRQASTDPTGGAAALIAAGAPQAGQAVYQYGREQRTNAASDAVGADLSQPDSPENRAKAYSDAAALGPDAIVSLKTHFASLDSNQLALTAKKNEQIGSILMGVKGVSKDPNERMAMAQHLAALHPELGFDPSTFEPGMFSDAAIDARVASTQSVSDLIAQHKLVSVAPGSTLVDPWDLTHPPAGGADAPAAGGAGGPEAAGAPAPAGPIVPSSTPAPTGGVYDQIATLAAKNGAQPSEVPYLQRLAQVESGGKAGAQNGSSTSYFQFHPPTFNSVVPGGNINDLGDQTKGALILSRNSRQALQSAGVTPDDANTYIMHQQGSGGGKALLTAPPEVGAVAALTPVYGSAHTALMAIAGNIGMPMHTVTQQEAAMAAASKMSAGDFVQFWRQRWGGGSAAAPTSQDAGGGQSGAAPPSQGAPPAPAHQPGVVFTAPAGHASTEAELASVHLPAGTASWTDATGKVQPYPADMQTNNGSMGSTVLHGSDYLATVPTAFANQVKAMAEGRLAAPTGAALRSPAAQRLVAAVTQYDPTFDAGKAGARFAVRKDFTSGKSAQNVRALNTAIGHLGELSSAIDGLGNYSLGINNWAARGIAEATGSDARFTKFETAKQAALHEFGAVIQGQGGGHVGDIERYNKLLDSAKSPAALHAVVSEMAELMNSRLEALGASYNEGMSTTDDPLTLLQPDKAAIFQRLRDGGSPTAAASGGATAQPKSQADFDALPSGSKFINPADGKVMVKK